MQTCFNCDFHTLLITWSIKGLHPEGLAKLRLVVYSGRIISVTEPNLSLLYIPHFALLNLHARSSKGDVEQLSLTSNDHASLASKLEVGSNSARVDLTDQLARGVPDMDTITAARVDTASRVSVDTIGDEAGSVGKGLAVAPGAVAAHVEGVDGGGGREVAAVETEGDAGVGDVGLLAIGGEGEAYSS